MAKNKEQRAAKDMVERMEKDRRMILHPDEWPRWPTLPMKRRDGNAHHPNGFAGFLMSGGTRTLIEGGAVVLYLDNMWRVPEIAEALKKENPDRSVMWSDICDRLQSKTFASLDALLIEYTID